MTTGSWLFSHCSRLMTHDSWNSALGTRHSALVSPGCPMILTDTTLPGYLHEFGLLGGIRVTGIRSSVRRSYCAGVALSDGQEWFVKQARLGPDGLALADLDRDAAVLGWANAPGSGRIGESLRRLLPDFHLHDAENRVLVTGYLAAHCPLAQ